MALQPENYGVTLGYVQSTRLQQLDMPEVKITSWWEECTKRTASRTPVFIARRSLTLPVGNRSSRQLVCVLRKPKPCTGSTPHVSSGAAGAVKMVGGGKHRQGQEQQQQRPYVMGDRAFFAGSETVEAAGGDCGMNRESKACPCTRAVGEAQLGAAGRQRGRSGVGLGVAARVVAVGEALEARGSESIKASQHELNRAKQAVIRVVQTKRGALDMVPPDKQLAGVDAGVDDAVGAASNSRGRGSGSGRGRGLVEEDHQTLNNQVNQYFQHIKQYAGGANGDDEEEDDEDEELEGDDDEEEDEDDDRYVHNNGVDVDVDFGVDLELNIDRAISESLANYNSAQMRDHSLGSGVSVGINVDPAKEHKGIMVNRQLGESARGVNSANSSSSAVNMPANSSVPRSGKAGSAGAGGGTGTGTGASGASSGASSYGVIGADVVLKSNRASSSGQLAKPLATQLKNEVTAESSKRECRFCGKTFQHAGSLGRHLDNQKGNELHPLEEVEKIRSNVARRGDQEAIKARRLQRSKEYNRREYVKEKNRLRRKFTSKLSRVKESYQMKFYRRINHPTLPTHPSFPRMVLFFLPPSAWPHDPPTAQTLKTLVIWLESNQEVQLRIPHLTKSSTVQNHLEKLTIGFENWQTLSTEDKKDMWIREQRAVFQQLLGDLSIFDFAIRDNWAKHLMEEKKAEIGRQKEIYHEVLLSDNTSRTDVNSDHGHQSSSHDFHDSEHHYSQSQNDSDDSTGSVHDNHPMVSMDPLRNVVDHMGPIGHMADQIGPIGTIGHIADHMADHMDNMEMDLDNMPGLGDHHDDNEVKLEEADLAAVAAAAAAAAVKENGGFHSVGGDR